VEVNDSDAVERELLENWKRTPPEIGLRTIKKVPTGGHLHVCLSVCLCVCVCVCVCETAGLGPKPHAEEKRRVVHESGVNDVHYGHTADSSSIEVNQLQQIKRWLEVTRTSTPTILCCRTQRERGPVGSAVAQGDPDRTMLITMKVARWRILFPRI